MKITQKGFTLIELMIVVVVVGILAAVALPSYKESVDRGRRSEAKAVLGQMQNWMERYYTENGRYDQNQFGQALNTAALAYPAAPGGGAISTYTIGIEALTATTFNLVATRAGTMAADKCGDYVVSSAGVRSVRNSTVGATEQITLCWGR
jgi:type IV pilus assembly protein PilE